MEKITQGHPLTQSPDFVKENIETLKNLFPTIVKEGKIDFEELKALLVDDLETDDEFYRFTWAGKSMARREATKPSTATLRPCVKESKNWDKTQNIFIEGDNLEVLKLLQKSYANRIKMIYIDPPYNTGKDFVYKDNYKDNLGNYLELTRQTDEARRRISTNTESDGRYHSNWLNMVYPRLKLARNLLMDDGVIFISIDDNEIHNLRKVCDEIFGEDNFLAAITWKHTQQSKNDERFFSRQSNYNIVYAKNINFTNIFRFNRTDEDNKNYANPDKDPKGAWRSGDVRSPNPRQTLKFPITAPNGNIISAPDNGWRWSEETVKSKIETGEIIFKKDYSGIIRKIYLSEQEGRTPENLWDGNQFGTTRIANSELKELFGENVPFDTPKPTGLISKMIELFQGDDEFIVLDFFGGSATTAHAVLNFNAIIGGNRKFIIVQIPEATDENSEAFKAGYRNICEIGKERIRRAGEKILNNKREELTKLKAKTEGTMLQDDLEQQIEELEKNIKTLDVGFKVFILDSSNINAWDGDPDKLEQTLFNAASNIKENRTEDDILYEILLKYGLDLAQPIEQRVIANKTVFNIGGGVLFICLADTITTDVADGIGKWKNELNPATCKVIFKDSGFIDVDKTNSMQIMKRYGIEEVNTI